MSKHVVITGRLRLVASYINRFMKNTGEYGLVVPVV